MHSGGSLSHISPIGGECVLLLPRVFEVLSNSGKSLPDDTSLEKLLDWFTGLTKAGEYDSYSWPSPVSFFGSLQWWELGDGNIHHDLHWLKMSRGGPTRKGELSLGPY